MPIPADLPHRRESHLDATDVCGEDRLARRAWLISLTFWLILFAAAGLYAAVALSPKLSIFLEIERRHYSNQVHLVELERHIDQLKRVAQALEHDAGFAAELARIDFDAHRPGDERIPVEADLRLGASEQPGAASVPVRSLRWYESVVGRLGTDRTLRRLLLTTAALSVIVAFTFLQESTEPSGFRPLQPMVHWFARRYQARAGE